MMFDWIALGVLGASLIGLAVVIIRKFPILASIDMQVAQKAAAVRKSNIVEERLRRKFTSLWGVVSERSAPIGQVVQSTWQKTHKKLSDLEHEYRVRSLPVLLNRRQRSKVEAETSELVNQARALLDDGETTAAEEKALQAIRYDPRSRAAFELLGELYLDTKEYVQAKEVYLYLLKLAGEDETQFEARRQPGSEFTLPASGERDGVLAGYYFDLANIYHELGEPRLALDAIEAATHIIPNNPKFLDAEIEISIAAGKKQFAADAVRQLAEVNPDNTKIADWQEQIAAMPDQHFVEPVPTEEPEQPV